MVKSCVAAMGIKAMLAMFGIGCDIERIDRFKKVLKNKRFLLNIFSHNELRYCLAKAKPELYLASKFACKEAVFKALSSLNEGIPLKLIEILNKDRSGSMVRIPYQRIDKQYRIFVSTSNTKDIVFASSIAERRSR